MNYPARPVIIKLNDPGTQSEFERQRVELELNHRESLSNEMFIAYLLDIRKAAMEMQHIVVDEHATEIIGHDDPEPKGEVN